MTSTCSSAHGPGDEGGSVRPEEDGGESSAVTERLLANIHQGVRECDGGESSAIFESRVADVCQGVGECEGGETSAAIEH